MLHQLNQPSLLLFFQKQYHCWPLYYHWMHQLHHWLAHVLSRIITPLLIPGAHLRIHFLIQLFFVVPPDTFPWEPFPLQDLLYGQNPFLRQIEGHHIRHFLHFPHFLFPRFLFLSSHFFHLPHFLYLLLNYPYQNGLQLIFFRVSTLLLMDFWIH